VRIFKNSNFDISDPKNALKLLATVEENELQENGRKSWKTKIMINLYCIDFFIVIKKYTKLARTFAPNNDLSV